MATEEDWLKLKLPDLKAALLGAGGNASGLKTKQSYAEALVALGVALPGGGGPQLLGGGAGGGGVGPVDVRSAKEQLAGCVADAELEKGLIGVQISCQWWSRLWPSMCARTGRCLLASVRETRRLQ